ncbi:hypothetical protein BKA93DRAFT_750597 [Sparassis latifolia]
MHTPSIANFWRKRTFEWGYKTGGLTVLPKRLIRGLSGILMHVMGATACLATMWPRDAGELVDSFVLVDLRLASKWSPLVGDIFSSFDAMALEQLRSSEFMVASESRSHTLSNDQILQLCRHREIEHILMVAAKGFQDLYADVYNLSTLLFSHRRMASIALRPLSPIIFPPKPCNLPTEDDFRFAWAYRNAVEKAMFIGRPAGLRPAHLVDAYAYETKVYMALFVNDVPSQGQEIQEDEVDDDASIRAIYSRDSKSPDSRPSSEEWGPDGDGLPSPDETDHVVSLGIYTVRCRPRGKLVHVISTCFFLNGEWEAIPR